MRKLLAILLAILFIASPSFATTRAVQIELLLSGLIHSTTFAPLAGGTVYFYAAGTSNAKNVWTEKAKTNPYTSITLDSAGMKEIYGDGIYKMVIKDSAATTIYTWDNVKVRADNYSVVTKIATYTATTDDDLILANGTFTITLYAAANSVQPLIVKNVGTGTVTMDGNGAETIDGSSTYALTGTDQTVMLISDGSNWELAQHTAVTLLDGATVNAFANTGVHIYDTGGDHDLIIVPGTDLSADRNFTITTGDGARTLTMNENLTIGDGTNVTITATDEAGSILLDEQTLEIEGEGTATRLLKIINAENAARTLTYNEDFTVGDGTAVTITGVTAARTLTMNENLTVGDGTDITITGVTAARTVTLNENLTVGDGTDITITGVTAARTLTMNEILR